MASRPKKRRRFVPTGRRCFDAELESSPSLFFTGASYASISTLLPPIPGGFNDPATADVILRLYEENCPYGYGSRPLYEVESGSISDSDSEDWICTDSELLLFVHSSVFRRAKLFADLLSDSDPCTGYVLEPSANSKYHWLHLGVDPGTTIGSHVVVIRLLYTSEFLETFIFGSSALEAFPVALKLVFEDCIKECARFADSWTEEEELRVRSRLSSLRIDEPEKKIGRPKPEPTEEMIQSLIETAFDNDSRVQSVKSFVLSLLTIFPTWHTASSVLEKLFSRSLKVARVSLEDRSSLTSSENLRTALVHCRHLLWLVERMSELRDEGSAVKEWSEQASFAADLRRILQEEPWRRFVPDIANLVLRCCSKLVGSVAAGSVFSYWKVRKQLVENWLPVLIVCKDNANASPVVWENEPELYSSEALHQELEEAFLKIMSTLPESVARELRFASDAWFRSATRRQPREWFRPSF